MVFESLVSNVLNKVLGEFVEDLDASKLNIGIWGGDIVLKDLGIKETALDGAELPFRVKYGYLGALTLSIPWKNLYTEPIVVRIDNLNLVVVPNKGIKYNGEKEETNKQANKQKVLTGLEEARTVRRKQAAGTVEEPAADTFAEKMISTAIKNLQLSISNIHIRYEDEYTNRQVPFCAGITLSSLKLTTTDENWKECTITEQVTLFHKLLDLNSLSIYWNSAAQLISRMDTKDQMKEALKSCVAKNGQPSPNLNYILEPMSIAGRLILNMKPETDGTNWQTPKVNLSVEVGEIGLNTGKYQYQNILEFAEAQERFALSSMYRKYRPDLVNYHGHAKEWWKFAINCILEEQIKRKSRNWSWAHIKAHRKLVKEYQEAWVDHLTVKAPKKSVLDIIGRAEKEMDVFNLNVARQQAELEVDRRGLLRISEQKEGWISWAKSWVVGSSTTATADPNKANKGGAAKDLGAQFNEAMTPEEKAKLFEAIDYEENQPPSLYPKEYVDIKTRFALNKLTIAVNNEELRPKLVKTEVMKLTLDTVGAKFDMRSAGSSILLKASIDRMGVSGLKPASGKQPPAMVSLATNTTPLLDIFVETKPLSGLCDQDVRLTAQPINVIYHAPTINQLVDVFKPPESVRLKQLSATAMAKYEKVKAQSTTGLAHAVENRSKLCLDITVHPTSILIPHGGVYTKNSSVLVIDLGQLSLKTVDSVADSSFQFKGDIREDAADERFRQVMEQAYDNFLVELRELKILFATSREEWIAARSKSSSPLHLLRPTGFEIMLRKSSVDDSKIPKIKILGNLPDVVLDITEGRALDLIRLALSIPTPPPAEEKPDALLVDEGFEEPDLKQRAKMKAIMEVDEDQIDESKKKEEDEEVENAQQVSLQMNLALKKIGLVVRRNLASDKIDPYLEVMVTDMGAELVQRPLDMSATAHIGNLQIVSKQFRDMSNPDHSLYLIDSPSNAHLLSLKFVQVNEKHPYFASDYRSTQQKITANFSRLFVNLHQEAFIDIQNFAMKVLADVNAIQAQHAPESGAEVILKIKKSASSLSLHTIASAKDKLTAKPGKRKNVALFGQARFDADRTIKMQLEAQLGEIGVKMGGKRMGVVMDTSLGGLNACVIMKDTMMKVTATLKLIRILDPHPETFYKKILAVSGEEMFSLTFIQYNRTEAERTKMLADEVDSSVEFRLNALRFIFLNLWVSRILGWVAPFQEAAVEASKQAGEAAQAQAKAAAENVDLKSLPKIRLNVDLKAPIIIIPQKSTSEEAFLTDLGRIEVNNGFSGKKMKDGKQTCQDTMRVKLSEVKLSRVVLDSNGTALAECQLLEPVTIDVSLDRNLTFSFFKDKPEAKVKIRMPPIVMSLSQEDYTVAMRILSQNLAETVPPPPPAIEPSTSVSTAQSSSATSGSSRVPADNRKDRVGDAGPLPAVEEETEAQVELHQAEEGAARKDPKDTVEAAAAALAIRFAFDIHLAGISASLYMGTSNLNKGLTPRNPKSLLGTVGINNFVVTGLVKDNGFLGANVHLVSITIDDKRPDAKGITRLMDTTHDKSKGERHLLDVAASKDDTLGLKADVLIRPFYFLVCPEFVGALLSFISVQADEDDVQTTPAGSPAKSKAGAASASNSSNLPEAQSAPNLKAQKSSITTASPPALKSQQSSPPKIESGSPAGDQAKAQEPPPMKISIYASIENPEIIIIEDASKPNQTQAIFLNVNMEAKYEADGDSVNVLRAQVKNLEMYSSYYRNPADKARFNVIKPVNFSLMARMDALSQKFEIDVSELELKVSPAVIRLLSGAAAGMGTQPEGVEQESERKRLKQLEARGTIWNQKSFGDSDYWFIRDVKKVEEAKEAFEGPIVEAPAIIKDEGAIVRMPSILFRLEIGGDDRTVPVILLQSAMMAEAYNWSSSLTAHAKMSLHMESYNDLYNVWEPFIEPISPKNGGFAGVGGPAGYPWEVTLDVKKQDELDLADDLVDDLEAVEPKPPKMSVTMSASDRLELTMTKTCMDTMLTLGDAFEKASKNISPPKGKILPGTASYLVYNETGLSIEVLDSESLIVEGGKGGLSIGHNEIGFLDPPESGNATIKQTRNNLIHHGASKSARLNLRVCISQTMASMETVREVDVSRAELRAFSLPMHSHPGDQWQLVAEITSETGRKVIKLRSIIKVFNELDFPVEVYIMMDTNLELCGRVEADETFNVPVPNVYNPTGSLYFKPIVSAEDPSGSSSASGSKRSLPDEYEATEDGIEWTNFKNMETTKLLSAPLSSNPQQIFYIHAEAQLDEGVFENTTKNTLPSQCWTISLQPPITLHNLLPHQLSVKAPFCETVGLTGGESLDLYSVSAAADSIVELSVELAGLAYNCALLIKEVNDEAIIEHVTFERADGVIMNLGISWTKSNGRAGLSVYAPYWMVNATPYDLVYKKEGLSSGVMAAASGDGSCCGSKQDEQISEDKTIKHQAGHEGPLLFSFETKDLEKSQKLAIRIKDGGWSDGVPVDTVGSGGRVRSTVKDGPSYDVSLDIVISYGGLTKILTFSPFYLVDNRSRDAIEIREVDAKLEPVWLEIPGESCAGFCPKSTEKHPLVAVRYKGETEESQPFPYTVKYESFAHIPSNRVGMGVGCTVSADRCVMVLEEFVEGAAPVLLINNSPYDIVYGQSCTKCDYVLQGGNNSRLFRWESLQEKREFTWRSNNSKTYTSMLDQDAQGVVEMDKKTKLYWASILLGRQRALVFTSTAEVARMASESYETEQADMLAELSMEGIGISLVNNVVGVDLIYVGIKSSGVVWEQKKNRFKAMSIQKVEALEEAYSKYELERLADPSVTSEYTVDKMNVDFVKMEIVRPGKATGRPIKRTLQPGMWFQYRNSAHMSTTHFKLHHLQVDNMLNASVFQTILAPIPPPKSVAAEAVPKPFVEVSLVKKNTEHSSVTQIKYFKVLVQEFAVKADIGLINGVLAFLSQDKAKKVNREELMAKDLELCQVELTKIASTAFASGAKMFFGILHFSPLKVHLSFSQGGSSGEGFSGIQINNEAINLLLKSVGVTLTEIQDIVFKLAYFEMDNEFATSQQLTQDITDHYVKQALRQMYVLVLGLDVIGNPFGLVRDLTSGVEDLFYEPFQGAIQGPEEFAEGLALGVKSLFGHALGGAAGAVGRITGTLGKGLAALSMDEEYQRKRQEAINRKPANAREGLAQGGRGLVMGFYDGVSGVITKPIQGAKQEGAKGFAKGVGKGLVGVVTRPTAGIVDFASSTLDAARKVADVNHEASRLRFPRFIGPDRIIRPYSPEDAEGNMMLQSYFKDVNQFEQASGIQMIPGAERGRFVETDFYVAHFPLIQNFYLFLTNRRVMVLSKSDAFGHWNVDWNYLWDELNSPPSVTQKGVKFELKDRRKGIFGLTSSVAGKLVSIPNQKFAHQIVREAQKLFNARE